MIGRIFNFVVLGECGLAWGGGGVATCVKLGGFIAIIVSNAYTLRIVTSLTLLRQPVLNPPLPTKPSLVTYILLNS